VIHLKKLKATPDAQFPTPEARQYRPGKYNPGVSLPVDYELRGFLIEPIKLGEPLIVWRKERNKVESDGYFHTSPVLAFTDSQITTHNSVYEYSLS
jgi:hypothetical protein